MKISVFGMLPFSHLIKEGLEKLGHEISTENPELIYANDPRGYKEAMLVKIKYKNAYHKKRKTTYFIWTSWG